MQKSLKFVRFSLVREMEILIRWVGTGNSKFCNFFHPHHTSTVQPIQSQKTEKLVEILFQTSAKPVSPSRHSTHMCFNSLFNCTWGVKFLIFRKLHISTQLMEFFSIFQELKKTVKMLRARLFFIWFFEGYQIRYPSKTILSFILQFLHR